MKLPSRRESAYSDFDFLAPTTAPTIIPVTAKSTKTRVGIQTRFLNHHLHFDGRLLCTEYSGEASIGCWTAIIPIGEASHGSTKLAVGVYVYALPRFPSRLVLHKAACLTNQLPKSCRYCRDFDSFIYTITPAWLPDVERG